MSTVAANSTHNTKLFDKITERFKAVTQEPSQFLLAAPPEKCASISALLQDTYQLCVDTSEHTPHALPELVLEEMDVEQIWQQVELRNNFVLPQIIENTSKLLSIREEKLEVRLDEKDESSDEAHGNEEENENENLANGSGGQMSEEDDEENMESERLDDDEEDEDREDEDEDRLQSKQAKKGKKRLRPSVVDDKFFKLSEMEEFLEAEDAKEMRKKKSKPNSEDTDGIDYFAEDFGDEDSDDDDANLKYKDFFDSDDNEMVEINDQTGEKKRKKNYFADEADAEEELEDNDAVGDEAEDDGDGEDDEIDDEDANNEDKVQPELDQPSSSDSDSDDGKDVDSNEKPKSSFEMRQERLQQRIRDYEEEVLGEKPWQLKGEIHATSRPQNSLLEEILEFESTVRPAPVITEETTRCLEDIIRQRIKDQAWDDVVAKVRHVQTPHDYRKQLVLDQEKSKESLAQIYEKEYQQEIEKLNANSGDNAAEEEPKEHKEIRRLMRDLFVKLDALSNFHFTPKPVAPEPRIITNTPAVAMEEVAPLATSNAKLLAPEEVYRGPKNELVGKTERSRTDKNRERRKKKQKQRAIHSALEAKTKDKQKLGIQPSKKEENAKLLKSLTKHRNVEKINATSDDQRALKSSKSFFSKLQDSTSAAASGTASKAAKKKSSSKAFSAKKLKL